MGTLRLAIVFGAGLVGLFYLIVVVTNVVNWGVRFNPTEVSIDALEDDVQPNDRWLRVTGGLVVLSQSAASMWDSGLSEGEGYGNPEDASGWLNAPVVSQKQWADWKKRIEAKESIDASHLRVIVKFDAREVAERWPEIARRLDQGERLKDVEPVAMTIEGVLGSAKFDGRIAPLPKKLDRDNSKIALVRQGRPPLAQPMWYVKNVALTLLLLGVSVVVWRAHRRIGDPNPPGGLDIPLLPGD